MKHLFLIISLSVFFITPEFGQGIKEQKVKTEINSVTVYLSGAEIHRNKMLNLKTGKTRLIFVNLSPKINDKSVRITTSKNVDLLGITTKINYLANEINAPRTKRLKDSLNLITDKIQAVADQSDAYNIEKKMLLANISIGGKDKGVSITDLKQASDFYRNRITEINTKLSKLKARNKKMNTEFQKIKNQLAQLNSNSNYSRSEISVLVSSGTTTSCKIELKYLLNDAGWSPSYDIKAIDTDKPVKLEYKAKVYNNSDIDWKNIKIKLSTADPNLSITKPVLNPWYLKYKVYSYANNIRYKKAEGYIQNKIQSSNIPSVIQENQLSEEDDVFSNTYTEAEVPELSAEFNIKKTYDIPSDDKPYIVDINEYELPATYKDYAVTKLDKDVFLLARITGWQDLNLIEGPANVYYAGTYLGQSFIDIRNVKDTLDLSLGRDGKVLVTRTKVKAYSSSKIIGTKRKETMTYELIARNNRKTDINLQISDQIPISQTDEIEVKVLNTSGAVMNETTGKLKWEFKLKPGETKKITLSFEIKYPKNKEIQTEQRKQRQIRYF
ncbi:MAG: DUF4139 domain-containing protein [Bacteroidales bacterium]|nr:DUF4139 domain-containing protein [Bacteroidales bacterium]